jgi:predicted HTH domain antitoxin
MNEVLDPFEIVLAFLYACRNSGRVTKIHVQKGLFIASQYSKKIAESLEFQRYRYGPWSEDVSDAVEQLKYDKLIEIDKQGFIRLSEKEVRTAEKAWSELPDEEKKVLSDVADFVSKLDKDELLLYTYIVFGSWEKSDVADKVLSRRVELAEKMYRRGVVSIGLAAELAGMSIAEFVEYLKQKGFKPFVAEEKDLEFSEKL